MRRILYLILLVLCVSVSCIRECLDAGQEIFDTYTVRFDLQQHALSRGSISPYESVIDDFNIYAYSRGKLMGSVYADRSEDAVMELNAGESYNMYVLANVGYVEPMISEDELLQDCIYQISTLGDIGEYIPFSGKLENVIVDRSGQRFSVLMERLVSKIMFNIDKSALDGLEVTSVRLRQSSMSVRPFCKERSAAVSPSDVMDGDFCTEEDLMALNDGEAVAFYALENCQGVLLPGNDDPWMKVPSSLDAKSDLCTYVEVSCSFDGSGLCEGDVVYRLYLGQDNCSDFNLVRNSVLNVSLCLTIEGMKDALSWRVTSDYSILDGYARGWVSRGNHNEHELYAGEKLEYSIWLSDQMKSYIGSELNDYEVFFRTYDKDEGYMRFSEIKVDENSGYYVDATCLRPSEGEICLRAKDGRFLAVLSDCVCIYSPVMVLSDKLVDGDFMMEADLGSLDCDINGDQLNLYLYFLDNESYNLNVSAGCGYDLEVFDLMASADADQSLMSMIEMDAVPGKSAGGGPVLNFNLRCVNDGRNHASNMRLLEACKAGADIVWNFHEGTCALNKDLKLSLRSLPVELTLMDNDWAGYGDSQLSVAVRNPSCLPIEVECWQFVTVNMDWDASLKEQADNIVQNSLIVNPMEYVTSHYPVSVFPVYGSSFSFVSERNSFGSQAIEDGELLVYDLSGIDTDDVIAALTSDGWGYDSMSHHFQVVHSDGSGVSELIVNDSLSDGSSFFIQKYNIDNLNDRGIWLYEGNSLILASDQTFKSYHGLTPRNIRAMNDQTPVVGMMSYDKAESALYIKAYSLGSEGLVLNSRAVVAADGYVRTYPNGTWGKEVDNYCHEEYLNTCTAFPVMYSNVGIVADGNAIAHVFDQVYSNRYYDSWNAIGSANNYMHSAHPTSLSMSMSFSISDKNDDGAYLFKPVFPSIVTYVHAQEGVEYNVPSNFSYSTFKFVEVKKK